MKKAMSLFLCVLFIASLSGCTKKVMYPEYTKLPFYLHALSEATVADTKQSVSSESKYFQLDLDETMHNPANMTRFSCADSMPIWTLIFRRY